MAGESKNDAVAPKIRKKREDEAQAEQQLAPESAPQSAEAAPEAPKSVPVSMPTPTRRVVDPKGASSAPRVERVSYEDTVEQVTTDDFAALFEGGTFAAPERRRVELVDQISGTIVHIDKSFVFVDMGGRGEGRAPRAQYVDEQGELQVSVGETRDFYVLRFTREGVVLGETMDTGQAGVEALEQAEAAGVPVEGRVTSRNKGGFVVEIANVETFCPISQIDVYRVEEDDLDRYLNQSYRFKVIEVREGGRSVVVSRAAPLGPPRQPL